MRFTIFAILGLASCAATEPGGQADPYEAMNRQVHAFNVGLDSAVIKPLSGAVGGGDGADKGEPSGLVTVASRLSGNLSLPGKVVNSVLQGRPEPAARNAARFVINSTLGLGGLHDPAGEEFRLPEVDTDFGETLAVWGVPEGAYLVLPVLGPSTERDFAGKIVDWVLDPTDAWLTPEQKLAARGLKVISKAGDRARFGGTVDGVLHGSADSYSQLRLLYLQHRRYQLGQEAEVIDPYAE